MVVSAGKKVDLQRMGMLSILRELSIYPDFKSPTTVYNIVLYLQVATNVVSSTVWLLI